MFSRKKWKQMEEKVAALEAAATERAAADEAAAEKERRKLPTKASSIEANQAFSHKGKKRLLVKLPSRAVSSTKSVDQWTLVDCTDGGLTRMGIVESKEAVLEYMTKNFYRKAKQA